MTRKCMQVRHSAGTMMEKQLGLRRQEGHTGKEAYFGKCSTWGSKLFLAAAPPQGKGIRMNEYLVRF